MKKVYLPLFWKFTFAIIAIVTLFGSINAYMIWTDVQKSLESESEKRAVFIAKSLSNQLIIPLLYEDLVRAQEIIEEEKSLDPFLKYIFIAKNGKLLLHTFHDKIPRSIISKTDYKADSLKVSLFVDNKNQSNIIRDISIPIFNGELGILRIGITENSILKHVKQTVLRFWVMVGFFLLFGIIAAFIFSYFITNPLKKIKDSTRSVTLETLNGSSNLPGIRRVHIFRNNNYIIRAYDEIDQLIENFNSMIARLKITYQELTTTQKKLIDSEKLATIGTISSGIAHEINNPINGIQNATRRIIKDPGNIEQNLKYLSLILSASERIEKVVKELLNFARKEKLNLEIVDIYNIIKRVELLLSYRIEKLSIGFFVFIDEADRFIFASPNHLEQVILNLILNSIDSIQESEMTEGKIIIEANNFESFTQITIEDNGSGISEEEIANIFDPFFTTKESSKGTGLGLAVTKQIVKSHGGEITVKSTLKKGTKFFINLPRKLDK